MDKKLRQQYNLPDFLTGKTPAEDHKILMKRFKDRKDPVSQRTMQSITEKLAQVQEDVKAQQNQGMMQEQAPMPEQGMPQGQVPQEQMPQQGAPDMGQMFAHGGKMNKYAHGGLHTPVGPNTPGASVDTVRDFDKFKDLPLKEFHRNMPLTDASFTQQPSAREEFTARALERGDISFEDAKTRLFPNQMGHGGKVNKYSFGDYMDTLGAAGADQMIAPGGIGQAAGLVSDGVGTIENFGKADKVDTSGNTSYDIDDYKKQKTKETALGAVKGVGQLGMGIATGNPMAIAEGAIGTIGAVGDIFGGGKKKAAKEMEKANFQHGQTQALNKTGISSFAYGGKVNKFSGKENHPSYLNTLFSTTQPAFKGTDIYEEDSIEDKLAQTQQDNADLAVMMDKENATKSNPRMLGTDDTNMYTTGKTKAGKALQAVGRFGKNNAADLLSLGAKTLPLLKKHDKPNTAGATRVQKEYTPQQFDEKRFINEQRASDNSKEQIRNLSGGDPAAARAMAMSANRNKLFATSKGMQAADDLNRSEKAKQFDSQSRNEQINARMTEIYKDRKAKDDAAYSKAEYDRKSQIGDNVSKFAKELSDKQTVVNMTGYRGNATYVTPEGKEVEVMEKDGKYYDKEGNEVTGKNFKKKTQ